MKPRAFWRWLSSITYRRALETRRHIRRLFKAQRDLLCEEALTEVTSSLERLTDCLRRGAPNAEIKDALADLKSCSEAWLYDNSKSLVREASEMFVVAMIVVMGMRTFFVLPMTIPSGSMEPTLAGVKVRNLNRDPGFVIPTGLSAVWNWWFHGKRYYRVVCESKGSFQQIEQPEPIHPWLAGIKSLRKQRFMIGNHWHTLWFPPTDLPNPQGFPAHFIVFLYAGVKPDHIYHPGEAIINIEVSPGDHVLVNRLSYNFSKPKRGDIVVFTSYGLPALQPETHYIKRLVALGGERVRIGDDQHLVINGKRMADDTPGFERVYNIVGAPREGVYSGYVNDAVAAFFGGGTNVLAPKFRTAKQEQRVPPNHYYVFGDNTMNSYDSRRWGELPSENVIGKLWMVYWPFSRRYGWGQD